ncbi:MAG: ATP-binding protein [Bacteroidales bacterium]|nr:ATP-binding protein [Bacteroidales bacterium]
MEYQRKNSYSKWFLLGTILMGGLILSYQWSISSRLNQNKITASIQKTIHKKEKALIKEFEILSQQADTLTQLSNRCLFNKPISEFPSNDICHYIFKNDSLIYWNENLISLPDRFTKKPYNTPYIEKLANGWYLLIHKKVGSYHHVGAIAVKWEYSIENNYLKNDFAPEFIKSPGLQIDLNPGKYSIYSASGTFLFNLIFSESLELSVAQSWILFVLVAITFIMISLFLYYFYHEIPWIKQRRILFILIFGIGLVAVRFFQQFFGFPRFLYQAKLFSPAWYSSSVILPSLGDFLINIIILFIFSIVFNINYPTGPYRNNRYGKYKIVEIVTSVLFCNFLFYGLYLMIKDVILNSSFSLQLQDVSGMVSISGLGILIILLLFCSYWLISSRIVENAINFICSPIGEPTSCDDKYQTTRVIDKSTRVFWNSKESHKVLIVLIGIIILCLPGLLFFRLLPIHERIILTSLFIVFISIFWGLKIAGKQIFSFPGIILFLTFFSITATWMMNNANDYRLKATNELFVTKLSNRRNPVTEIMFEKAQTNILSDSTFWQKYFTQNTDTEIQSGSIQDLLKERYFTGYWDKYNIQITVCDSIKKLTIQPQGDLFNCLDFFNGVTKDFGRPTGLQNLFFLDYGYGKENYLGVFSPGNIKTPEFRNLWTFIEINLNSVSADPGFPGLLIDKSINNIRSQGTFSYAIYKENRLLHSFGQYPYPTQIQTEYGGSDSIRGISEIDYIHEIFPLDTNTILLISKLKPSLWNWMTPFPYLFFLFSIFIICYTLVIKISNRQSILQSSLQNKMYVVLIGILILTMIITGCIQVFNILSFNLKKENESLKERASSIRIEIQHKFGNTMHPGDINVVTMDDFLIKLSNVFFTEINFYGSDGLLLSTSRPQLFTSGIISDRMNPEAMVQLLKKQQMTFVHKEQIGEMDFLSAYIPLYGIQNNLLGYINLPYFSKGDESKREIASFLVTFINIYIVLLIFGVFFTILISKHITAPLDFLAVKLSGIRVGKSNEKIIWKTKDEIGQLVIEYNRMVDELEHSARLLAQSERESAWREMARQVAHEIKNPLTPMKLSAQYFEKAWKENAPDLDMKLSRFINTLITQIDILSEISSDFSNFAQLPRMKFELVRVNDVVNFVVSLYRDSSPIQFQIYSEGGDHNVIADRSQLNRVFTNLINNSIQAIEGKQNGKIDIKVWNESAWVYISVTDNGSGISPDQERDIFKPGFTTKQRGMGLGLVIVKMIIENFRGEITFTRPATEGACFLIKIPANQNQLYENETDCSPSA